jgi:hypothetical protein
MRVRIMDEEKTRKELSAVSADDEDYLCGLDEEFCDLSAEGEDLLGKRSSDVSSNEPVRKKARTGPGPSHTIFDSTLKKKFQWLGAYDNNDDNTDAADEPSQSESEVSDDGSAPPTQVGLGYGNVTNQASVLPQSNMTLGQKSTGP